MLQEQDDNRENRVGKHPDIATFRFTIQDIFVITDHFSKMIGKNKMFLVFQDFLK